MNLALLVFQMVFYLNTTFCIGSIMGRLLGSLTSMIFKYNILYRFNGSSIILGGFSRKFKYNILYRFNKLFLLTVLFLFCHLNTTFCIGSILYEYDVCVTSYLFKYNILYRFNKKI